MVGNGDVVRGEARLSEDEVRDVLERASRIEAGDRGGGLTVSELHDVARQVGIPPEALSRALSEVVRASGSGPGATGSWVAHREVSFVDGYVADDDLAWMIRLLDRLGQIKGSVTHSNGAVRWRTPGGLHLEVLNRPHETYVSVEVRDHYNLLRKGAAFTALGLTIGVVGVEWWDTITPLFMGASAGGLSFGLYWKIRVEKLRAAVTKASKGVSEVLQMVVRRPRGGAEE